MAVPKKRKSHSRTRMQRAHDGLTIKPTISCPQCNEAMRPHVICACGFYRGRAVIERKDA